MPPTFSDIDHSCKNSTFFDIDHSCKNSTFFDIDHSCKACDTSCHRPHCGLLRWLGCKNGFNFDCIENLIGFTLLWACLGEPKSSLRANFCFPGDCSAVFRPDCKISRQQESGERRDRKYFPVFMAETVNCIWNSFSEVKKRDCCKSLMNRIKVWQLELRTCD